MQPVLEPEHFIPVSASDSLENWRVMMFPESTLVAGGGVGEGLGGRMVSDGVFGEAVGVESEGVGVGCVELQSGGLFLSLSVMLSGH